MSKEPRDIWNWHVTPTWSSLYKAPELRRVCLSGTIAEHKGRKDCQVMTSYIVAVDGKLITTRSGSVYRLGEIDPEYRKYLAEERPNWDPENPITIKG